jgi:hypothetical protein
VGGSLLPAASAAAALASLHGHKIEPDWDSEGVCEHFANAIEELSAAAAGGTVDDGADHANLLRASSDYQDWHSDNEGRRIPRTSIELPPIHLAGNDITSDPFTSMNSRPPRDILPSILANSPPGRSSTLPPLQRPLGPNRPRKQSVTKRGREAHHKRQKSRGGGAGGGGGGGAGGLSTGSEWLRRIQNDDRLRPGNDNRKALSAEPSADYGKRWEDLIDAADQAASMAGDIEERTPVGLP